MPPKVAKLGPLSGYNKQRRCRDLRLPAGPRRSMALRQPHIAKRGFQSFTNGPAIAKPDFIHSCKPVRSHSVSASVDDEHSDARKGQDRLSTPFFNKLRGHHRETGKRQCAGVCEDAPKRNERLSGAALSHCRSTFGLLPTLDDAHDRHGLGRKRTPLQLLQRWPDGIVRTMQGRKTSKYMLAQRRTVHTEVIRNRCECSHSPTPSEEKGPRDGARYVLSDVAH